MGKVTTYCQISGCSPEVDDILDSLLFEETPPTSASELEKVEYKTLNEAFKLLSTEDEKEGTQALSIPCSIFEGPYKDNNKPVWGFEEEPNTLEALLAEAEGHVRVLSGCRMGNMFDMGYCHGPMGQDDGAIISYGGYFFVQTYMLPILTGATQGRVSVERLWRLVMAKGHFNNTKKSPVITGVDYGPIYNYLEQYPWILGDVEKEELLKIGGLGTPEDIAEVLRTRGFWMWMRPDRFPLTPATTIRPITTIAEGDLSTSLHEAISKLPPEILQYIALELDLKDIIVFATLNKTLYWRLIGTREARDSLAKAYIRTHARWCLPSGEAELNWWNERNGDDSLVWEYLERCWSKSHSMRNRRRIWKAAESIEEQYDKQVDLADK
ncbi:unnamed protein product [Rhizoctonia solani]|uniref:F-box domain-containing protein n=1 Tax=Rhizoctonia solani TaxID=456999 RepID=A0A8H2WJ91_9AGAM|nr:unnamed protein product [Rhizoctonia solani]